MATAKRDACNSKLQEAQELLAAKVRQKAAKQSATQAAMRELRSAVSDEKRAQELVIQARKARHEQNTKCQTQITAAEATTESKKAALNMKLQEQMRQLAEEATRGAGPIH